MSEREDRAWRQYAERFRREGLQKVIGSGACISLYTGDGTDFDVQQAMELGAMLLLDKPLILVTTPGAKLPSRLAKAGRRRDRRPRTLTTRAARRNLKRAVLLATGGGS
jgi:hypothetical protein